MAIARVAAPVNVDRLFDYWLPAGLPVQAGSVVRIMLGRRRMHGVAVELVDRTDLSPERILPIQEVVPGLPALPSDLCELARFVAAYYHQPIGQCFAELLPPLGAGRARRATMEMGQPNAPTGSSVELNGEQRTALADLLPESHGFAASLLQGVTGSGKTEVYLAAAERVMREGRQVLMLVPEIHLTPQLEQRIAAALPGIRVATLHS